VLRGLFGPFRTHDDHKGQRLSDYPKQKVPRQCAVPEVRESIAEAAGLEPIFTQIRLGIDVHLSFLSCRARAFVGPSTTAGIRGIDEKPRLVSEAVRGVVDESMQSMDNYATMNADPSQELPVGRRSARDLVLADRTVGGDK
jgi:hypothetical protein